MAVTAMLFLLLIAMGVALFRLTRRVAALEARLADTARPAPEPPPLPEAAPARPRLHRPRPSLPRVDLEVLVGARLPIWIGGLALVVAGIFLVRLSIEAGWLTPPVRTLLAALFAAALLGGSEAAHRLPATRDDPRVGQVLAGAGIASAYATLYLAAALYHLVPPLAGFALMLAVTALGLFLALRHGPPTAVMALIGGFAAPLVAGYDAAGIAPLLAYLALFVAALLALAGARGWGWLALTTLAAAFGWSGLLIALLPIDTLGGVGAFVVALGVGGTLALPRAPVARPAWRLAPLLVALVQLLALAPALDFSALAWSFHLILSAAALFLAWRDARLLPGAVAAAVLVTLLIAAGLAQGGDNATAIAWPVAPLLFGAVGGMLSRRAGGWTVVALAGTAAPLLVAQLLAADRFAPPGWAALDLVLAAAGAALGWRHRDRRGQGDIGLVGGIAVAATGVALALGAALPASLAALAPLAALGILVAALGEDEAALGRLALLPVAVLVVLAVPGLAMLAGAIAGALLFEALPYNALPTAGDAARFLLPFAVPAGLALWRTALFVPLRRATAALAATIAILGGYVLLKQPLAIATLPRFVALGFVERAVLTDLALLAGWAAWTRLPVLGRSLVTLALARLVYFDLLGLNPLWIEQAVGPLPLLNAATLHLTLVAAVLWRLERLPRRRLFAALLTLLAVLATLRQATHGTLLTGPLGTTENWSYSAAMLALAIVWLWRGRRVGDLRRLGLSLLTLTTLKVFLIDAAALGGVWRILSFLGLGLALIAIGWGYRRFVTAGDNAPPAGPAPA